MIVRTNMHLMVIQPRDIPWWGWVIAGFIALGVISLVVQGVVALVRWLFSSPLRAVLTLAAGGVGLWVYNARGGSLTNLGAKVAFAAVMLGILGATLSSRSDSTSGMRCSICAGSHPTWAHKG